MGVGANFGEAFSKAQLSAGMPLPDKGCAFLSVNDHDKPSAVEVGKRLAEFGFCLATRGTAVAEALASRRRDPIRVWSLQEIHGKTAATPAVH